MISDFSYIKGFNAGLSASECAIKHKIPKGAVIYFAVDLDVYADQISEYIIPFFRGINDTLNRDYKVGIYGPRLVCTEVSNAELSVSSFVADMSSGYSCNIGQKMPSNWCYDQYCEISNFNNDFDIDKVTYNGKIEAADHIREESSNIEKLYNQMKNLYDLTNEYSEQNNKGWSIIEKNKNIMDYLRNVSSYVGTFWDLVAGAIDQDYIAFLDSRLTDGMRREDIKVPSEYGEMEITHLAASISSLLYRFIAFDQELNDLTGWAGDLLQLGGNIEKIKSQHLCSDNDVYRLIGCTEDEFAQSLGFEDAANTGFGWVDLEQDIDAVNIAVLIIGDLEIYKIFAAYYGGKIYNSYRISSFIKGIGVDTIVENKIKEKAQEYTDLNKATVLAFCAFFGTFSKEDFSEKLSSQFAKKIMSMYEKENH